MPCAWEYGDSPRECEPRASTAWKSPRSRCGTSSASRIYSLQLTSCMCSADSFWIAPTIVNERDLPTNGRAGEKRQFSVETFAEDPKRRHRPEQEQPYAFVIRSR